MPSDFVSVFVLQVTSLSPSVEVEAAYLQSASLKASLIQRHWRRWHEEKPVKAPLSVTAEVVVDAMSENHFAEPMQEARELSIFYYTPEF